MFLLLKAEDFMECTRESEVEIFFLDLWFLTSSVSNKVQFARVNEGCV